MSDIRVRVGQQSDIRVRVGQQDAIKVVSLLAGTKDIALAGLTDVNIGTPLKITQSEED